jgi:hypothetical protein
MKSNMTDNVKRHRFRVKFNVIKHYSNGTFKCKKCGFSDMRALQLDHINGNGKKETQLLKRSGNGFYSYLINNNYPDGYQILCANCNWIKKYENNENHKSNPELNYKRRLIREILNKKNELEKVEKLQEFFKQYNKEYEKIS